VAYSGSDGATATAESVSQGFRVFCMLKTAAKCTQTYHFGDKNDFFSREVPSPLHHTPLPSTPTAHRPHPTFLNEILNTPLVSIFTFIIVRQSFHLQRQNLTSAAAYHILTHTTGYLSTEMPQTPSWSRGAPCYRDKVLTV